MGTVDALSSLCAPLWAQALGRHSTPFIWRSQGLPSGWKGLQTLSDDLSTIPTDSEPQRSTRRLVGTARAVCFQTVLSGYGQGKDQQEAVPPSWVC